MHRNTSWGAWLCEYVCKLLTCFTVASWGTHASCKWGKLWKDLKSLWLPSEESKTCVVRDLREGPRLYSVREPTRSRSRWGNSMRWGSVKTEGIVILFLESLRICCVLCESRKLTKITSFARGIYSKSPHGLVPCLEYYRCSICGTVRWTRVPGSSPHSIPASQSESRNASATMADGLAWNEFVVGNARCKFAVSEQLLWKKRKLSLQMNARLW